MDTDAVTQIVRYPIGVAHGVLQPGSEALNALSAVSDLERAVIFGDIEKQLLLVSDAAAALIDGQCNSLATESDEAFSFLQSAPIKETTPPGLDSPRGSLVLWLIVGILLVAVCFICLYKTSSNWYFDRRDDLNGIAAINSLAKRIIRIESRGDPNARNSHSSAEGSGQFLNQTWLELIRKYRPDLAKGHNASELLDLRRNPKLTHAIMLRSIEQNLTLLRRRGLPVNAGTVFLTHFAGRAGALAILSAPDNADAALVMAKADSTGRTTRSQIVRANPFLEHFTVFDLKAWADRKMRKAREDTNSG